MRLSAQQRPGLGLSKRRRRQSRHMDGFRHHEQLQPPCAVLAKNPPVMGDARRGRERQADGCRRTNCGASGFCRLLWVSQSAARVSINCSGLESWITMTPAMNRSLAAMLHNPRARTCGCTVACWCRRTSWGRLLRWYLPKSHSTQPPPDWKRFKHFTKGRSRWHVETLERIRHVLNDRGLVHGLEATARPQNSTRGDQQERLCNRRLERAPSNAF